MSCSTNPGNYNESLVEEAPQALLGAAAHAIRAVQAIC